MALVVVGLMASVLTLSPPGEAAAQVEPVSVVLEGTARDFREGVPWDFQSAPISNDRGIVKADLGADSKPVYAYEPPARSVTTSGRENFDVWYRDTPGINVSIPVPIELARVPGSNPAVYRYSNGSFFPVDNQGFGNQGRGHNYSFTYELHTQFVYQGGESFRFTGDDDVFVFINGSLAIDLGGIHGAQSATVDLDTFAASHGMVAGDQYRLDLFFAERRTSASSFSIETGLLLEDLPPLTADAGTDQVVAEGSTVSLAGSASVSP